MKIKQGMQYYLHEFIRATGIYYLVIVCVYLLSQVAAMLISGSGGEVDSLEMSTFVFLFVLGLNGFKSQFKLFGQNGISRRTLWCSFLLSALALTAVVTVIDSLIPMVFVGRIQYNGLFNALYRGAKVPLSAMGLLWNWMMYFALMCTGFCITSLYYRMNRWLKILVSAGVPILLFFVLPLLSVYIPSFNIFPSLLKAFLWVIGKGGGQSLPMRTVGVFAGLSVVTAGLAYLLQRRAVLKDT